MDPVNYRKPLIPYGWLRVLIFMPVWFIVISLFAFLGFKINEALNWDFLEIQNSPFSILGYLVMLISVIILIWIFRKKVDRQTFSSLGFWVTERRLDLFTGFLLGAILIGVGAFILGQTNHIEFSPGTISSGELARYALLFLMVSIFEELVFRGYILNNLMQSMNKYLALALTAIPFGLVHILNANVEVLGILNVILAGFFLGATYIYTKNLWFPIGLHWSWNFFQGPIFGYEVSGNVTTSLLKQELLIKDIHTGGDFGFEASIIATLMIVGTTILLMFLYSKKKKV